MSGSTKKKARKEAALNAGGDKKYLEKQQAANEEKKRRTFRTVAFSVLAVLIVFAIIFNTGVFFRTTTAAKVGGQKITPAEMTYYYKSAFNTYLNYSNYYGYDFSSMYTTEDYMNMGIEQLQQVKALASWARENGVELEDSVYQEIDDNFTSLETQVVAGGYKDLKGYLEAAYGAGVTPKLARAIAVEQELAAKARTVKQESISYTDEELEAAYQAMNGDGDKYDYISYYFAAETFDTVNADGETVKEPTAESVADAGKLADALVSAYNALTEGTVEERFDEAVATVKDGASGNVTRAYSGSSLNAIYADWMKDTARKEGDIYSVLNAAGTGYNVVVFLGRNDNHYPTVGMRHILISAEADDDGNYTDEALAVAHAAAEAVYETWKNGEATEASFAALANESSTDGGSNTNGGLYEDIYKGQMVTEIDAWLFDPARSIGDTEIIDVVSTGYAGTHIVFFTGEGEMYSNVVARDSLSEEVLSAWEEELYSGFELKKGWTWGLVGK